MECTHRAIRSWSQLDGSPVQMWSCVDCGWRFEPVRERQPLTKEAIAALLSQSAGIDIKLNGGDLLFARAIERAHGIGGEE